MPRLNKQKSDLTLGFVDSGEQVAKLAKKSEMAGKIDKMRSEAKSNEVKKSKKRGTEVIKSNTGDANSPRRSNSPKGRTTLSPDAFKKKYSQDGALLNTLGSLVGQTASPSRFRKNESSSESEDHPPADPVIVNVGKNPKKDDDNEWGI